MILYGSQIKKSIFSLKYLHYQLACRLKRRKSINSSEYYLSLLPWSQVTIVTIRFICIFRLKLVLFSQNVDPIDRNYAFFPGSSTGNTTDFKVQFKATLLKYMHTQKLFNCKSSKISRKHYHLQGCCFMQLENCLDGL